MARITSCIIDFMLKKISALLKSLGMVLECPVVPWHIAPMNHKNTKNTVSTNTSNTTLTHISDFHLPITDNIPTHKLISKRLLGWANLRFNRGKTHKKEPFLRLLSHLKEQESSLCIATGDFVNLALPSEFAHMASIFRDFGFTSDSLFCIPGNHDRYTPGAQLRRELEKNFRQWIPFENDREIYPTLKIVGHAAIIGLNTATWRGPLRAAGNINQGQLDRLDKILNGLDSSLIPVVAMHHPPFTLTGHRFKHYLDGMQNFSPIVELLQGKNAVILHGHIHILSYTSAGDIRVVGVPSASNDTQTGARQLAYNKLEVSNKGLENVNCTRYWPNTDSFETFTLNENCADL